MKILLSPRIQAYKNIFNKNPFIKDNKIIRLRSLTSYLYIKLIVLVK